MRKFKRTIVPFLTLFIVGISAFSQECPELVGNHISGRAEVVAIKNSNLFLGVGYGILIFDISNPRETQKISQYILPYGANSIDIVDNYAYVAAGFYGLVILDITNPKQIIEVGQWRTMYYSSDVEVVNGIAYIANYSGLCILDVCHPSEPVVLGEYSTPGLAGSVAVYDNTAYVTVTCPQYLYQS